MHYNPIVFLQSSVFLYVKHILVKILLMDCLPLIKVQLKNTANGWPTRCKGAVGAWSLGLYYAVLHEFPKMYVFQCMP
jgi:hypothetical protein